MLQLSTVAGRECADQWKETNESPSSYCTWRAPTIAARCPKRGDSDYPVR